MLYYSFLESENGTTKENIFLLINVDKDIIVNKSRKEAG